MQSNRLDRPTLQALQAIQARFDSEHGFDFTAGAERPSLLERTSFAALALAGEVGELANAMKKAQRAQWLGDDPAPYLCHVADETADVLAYLLKLVSLLDVDLDELYLTTMSDNCLRFRSFSGASGRIITIAGPSGSGKTTVARGLSHDLPTLLEDVTENPHLQVLFAQPEVFDAYANQRWFIERFSAHVRNSDPARSLVLDQDPAAVVRVYARMFREQGILSSQCYIRLLQDLLTLESELARWGKGRATIFLDASAEVLRSRAILRGDVQVPPVSWFERLRSYFHELRGRIPSARLIVTDDLSPEDVLATAKNDLGLA